MRQIIAKQIRGIAFETVGLRTSHKRYYRYLKKRYNRVPRTQKKGFFDQFQHANFSAPGMG